MRLFLLLLAHIALVLSRFCVNEKVWFRVMCNGEWYRGPLHVQLVDSSPLLLSNVLYEKQYYITYEDMTEFETEIDDTKDCSRMEPKLILRSTCPKPLKYRVYGAFLALEAPRRFLTPRRQLEYKVEIKLPAVDKIQDTIGEEIDLYRGSQGYTEIF